MNILRSITLGSYERRRRRLDSRAETHVTGTIREMWGARIKHGIAGRMCNRARDQKAIQIERISMHRFDRVAETLPIGNTLFTRYRSGVCGIKNRACGHRNCWIYRAGAIACALSRRSLSRVVQTANSRDWAIRPALKVSYSNFYKGLPTPFVIFSFRPLPSFFSLARSRSLGPLFLQQLPINEYAYLYRGDTAVAFSRRAVSSHIGQFSLSFRYYAARNAARWKVRDFCESNRLNFVSLILINYIFRTFSEKLFHWRLFDRLIDYSGNYQINFRNHCC